MTENGWASFQNVFNYHVSRTFGIPVAELSLAEAYSAAVLTARESLSAPLRETLHSCELDPAQCVHLVSMDYTPWPFLAMTLTHFDMWDAFHLAVSESGQDPGRVLLQDTAYQGGRDEEGRSIIDLLDGLTHLGTPCIAYGLDYSYGMFAQTIHQGEQAIRVQQAYPKNPVWSCPWRIERKPFALYGHVEGTVDQLGHFSPVWHPRLRLFGRLRDLPIGSMGGRRVNILRLCSAEMPMPSAVHDGESYLAWQGEAETGEQLARMLLPYESLGLVTEERLQQEYLLAACAVSDILTRIRRRYGQLSENPEVQTTIHLHGASAALVVPELMRILMDEEHLEWEEAWAFTNRWIVYDGLSQPLDAQPSWPVPLFERVLPRHLQIIFEINHRLLDTIQESSPGNSERLRHFSLIEETHPKRIRMAHLALVSCREAINPFSQMSSLDSAERFFQSWRKQKWHEAPPGASHRFWVGTSNRELSRSLSVTLGENILKTPEALMRLESLADDSGFRETYREFRLANKTRLTQNLRDITGDSLEPTALFKAHVGAIQPAARHTLTLMQVVLDYLRITEDGVHPDTPCAYFFGGKADPGDWAAKAVLQMVWYVAETIRQDKRCKDCLWVVLIPDYASTTWGSRIAPAIDITVQAGRENMLTGRTHGLEFILNGARILAVANPSNQCIKDVLGKDLFCEFGMAPERAQSMMEKHTYEPWRHYANEETTRRVLNAINSELFCKNRPNLLGWFHQHTVEQGDCFMHLADFQEYQKAHQDLSIEYKDADAWAACSIRVMARASKLAAENTAQFLSQSLWFL